MENAPLPRSADYESWSKKKLILRLRTLETANALPCPTPHNSKKDDSAQENETAAQEPVKKRKFDFARFTTRFVAFRFAYLGWNYNGLNYQQGPTPLPTVEQEILEAMATARLITSADPAACDFSRCGRTDKGVSALNQVISLTVRSSLAPENHAKKEMDAQELPYIAILNSLLPTDIRITAVCLHPPPGFDARFSCRYRHYKYLFRQDGLEIARMLQAAAMYEGTHDFRNFCKVDGSKQITNHVREVYSAQIVHHCDDFYVFDLKGSAFLWHQVRCMIAVLFLVGQKLEEPTIVQDLLDVTKFPGKPAYAMASDVPLVLYDCVFPEMEWLTLENDFGGKHTQKLRKDYGLFNGLLLDYELKANVARMMAATYLQSSEVGYASEGGAMNIGDGVGRPFKKYIPLAKRELGESVAEINRKHREKKSRKLGDRDAQA
ncbi:tRNA pseudouridine synthase [Metschnikowia bicuspidata]|uniref:tRNA pseudouridine synthase n=1 Tax=Metschnikowia bicuspidata TaxID=27322 RepID=A0A4P9ZC59_9ASCO|nr:tRNA pseudouridine synthase [Metschnikowia bicuspidata]